MRKMLNQGGERTLIAAIIPPKTKHIDGIFGITIEDVGFYIFPFGFTDVCA